jgi:hypothetical protein
MSGASKRGSATACDLPDPIADAVVRSSTDGGDATIAAPYRNKANAVHTGSCHCGAVRFEVSGALHPPDACHCSQCRKQSGHYWASTDVRRSDLTIHGGDAVTWFQSSEKVRRGFCSRCGSALFWDALHRDKVGIGMGAFDQPTGVKLGLHIFVADKGDYYDIADGLPQHAQ